ncbi:PREDICTED: egg cell-secreted 1 [Prunus dulcis]|uniref:PREDICTED: egg cell-secreted 1 n=1 Tax=Prunus dulcis TaxID=3755 RepID=A0A5E4G600_PRUDU|nr:egg cell-secreted protein 1.1-like [Prunus dulcis]VVA35207.1 PREDICTED: egg cell-secreted 1 [Prunus dulcis]
MAAYTTFKLFLLTALLALTMPFLATSARPLNPNIILSNSNLVAWLNLDEESSNCWDSLFQLQSCSSEVVMFFLNGETYLGHSCCEAIRTIEHQCRPALLGTLGFTVEETDVLKGYCDEADHVKSPPSNPPSPPSSHDPSNVKVVPGSKKLVP